MTELSYRGMSYERASREAERIIQKDGWFRSFERLAQLRELMLFELEWKKREAKRENAA